MAKKFNFKNLEKRLQTEISSKDYFGGNFREYVGDRETRLDKGINYANCTYGFNIGEIASSKSFIKKEFPKIQSDLSKIIQKSCNF